MACRKAAGAMYLRLKTQPNQPFIFIGNAQATLNTEVEELSVPDYTNPAGGNACTSKDVSKVSLDLTMYDFKSDNLARAIQGGSTVSSVATITDEVIRVFAEDTLCPTRQLINTSVPPVLSLQSTPATLYVINTDFTAEAGGIRVIAGSSLETAINATVGAVKSLVCLIDYTPRARVTLEALTRAGDQYEFLLIAQNRAKGNKTERWNIYTVEFGPASALNLVTREFGSLDLTGECLPDITKGDGLSTSRYYQIQDEI
jgi:hypothetical protein